MVTKYGIDSSKIEELAKQFKEAADNLAKNAEEGGCYRFCQYTISDNKIDKNVYIVLGWAPGYDEHEADKYYDEGYRLAVKVGYQSVDNIMQTDYDIDFNQVYDKETGDVYDTEIALYENTDFENVAKQIVADYNYVLSSWRSWAHD